MNTFMTPRLPVQVLPYVGNPEDDYGNETGSWGQPETHLVYGWAPAGSTELETWRRVVTADLSVYAPKGVPVDANDKVVVVGLTYTVEGEIEDYNFGPFGFEPGIVINLRRVESHDG